MAQQAQPQQAARRKVVVSRAPSAGVGRAVARAFAARGADVGLIARGIDGARGRWAEVEQAGGPCARPAARRRRRGRRRGRRGRVGGELGPIDLWVNNAMVSVFAPVAEMTPRSFDA